MHKSLLLIALCSAPLVAEHLPIQSVESQPVRTSRWKKIWRGSLVALAAANALDIASSYGKIEGNQLLGSPAPFGRRAVAIKVGLQVPLVAHQLWITRKPATQVNAWRASAITNFALAGALAAVAAHNFAVARPQPGLPRVPAIPVTPSVASQVLR